MKTYTSKTINKAVLVEEVFCNECGCKVAEHHDDVPVSSRIGILRIRLEGPTDTKCFEIEDICPKCAEAKFSEMTRLLTSKGLVMKFS